MFDWQEYLVLADNLYDSCGTFSNKEACLRASISRAYYAAFCTARNYAQSSDKLVLAKNAEDHGVVKRFYENNSDKKRKRVGVLLKRLRNSRNAADYTNVIIGLDASARTAIIHANDVIKLLNEIYVSS